MSIKRIFIVISAIFAASAVFADNSSVTSKKYVDDLISGYQGKLPGSGANTLMIYDDEAGIGAKSIETTLVSNATSVPTVSAVKTGLDGKQDTITGTAGYVMTGTGNPGEVGEKPIYSTTIRDEDSLVTAESVNSGVINAVNHSLRRVNANGELDNNGTLWEIADTVVGLSYLPPEYTQLEWIKSTGTQYITTNKYCASNNVTIDTKIFTTNMLGASEEQDIIGNLVASAEESRFVIGLYSKTFFVYDRDETGQDKNVSSSTLTGEQTLNIHVVYDSVAQKRTLNLNGTIYEGNYTKTIANPNRVITLLSYPGGTRTFIGKVYYLKYMENGILKMNLIPAKRDNNGTIQVGFYDTVNNEFLTSSTSSAFIAGPAVAGN